MGDRRTALGYCVGRSLLIWLIIVQYVARGFITTSWCAVAERSAPGITEAIILRSFDPLVVGDGAIAFYARVLPCPTI